MWASCELLRTATTVCLLQSLHTDWASIKKHERWAEPSWESTHVMTSLGSDKLVVPEEKMADHEEQLSDEEKVRCQFNHHINSNWRDVSAQILSCM